MQRNSLFPDYNLILSSSVGEIFFGDKSPHLRTARWSFYSHLNQQQHSISVAFLHCWSWCSLIQVLCAIWDMLSVFSGVATVCIPPPPIRKMSRFLLMKLVAYLDQTAASRDWFSSWVWTRALPLRRLAAGIVLDLLAGVWHAAAAVRHRLSSVRLQARSGSPWRSFTASNRWTDGAHVFSKFCHGVTFGVFSVFLAFMKAAELPTATAIHTDTAVPSCYVNDRRPCA